MLNTSLYNGEGQRIRKTDGSSANGDYTMYFYMGGSLAFSTNSDANYITDENILDPNGTIIAANGRITYTMRRSRKGNTGRTITMPAAA